MKRSPLLLLGLLLAMFGLGGCGGDDRTEPEVAPVRPGQDNVAPGAAAGTSPTAEPVAPANPDETAGAALTLTPGGPAVTAEIPAASAVSFTIAQPGEYQIDASAMPMDVKIYLDRDGQNVAQDDDGGDRNDARIARFLDPGTYTVRVAEYRARAAAAIVRVQTLAPLAAAGRLEPGGTVSLQTTGSGDGNRGAAAEVDFVVATAGVYTLDATTQGNDDPKMLVHQAGRELGQNDDGGEGRNARLTLTLDPGTYRVRVWNWGSSPDAHTFSLAAAAAAPGARVTPLPPAPLAPSAAAPTGPTVQVDGPPLTLTLPAGPTLAVNLTEPGEYQLDAMAQPMDVKVRLFAGDREVASDDDGGEGTDARVIEYLNPGAYTVRLSEFRARAASARVQLMRLPPLPSAGALTIGIPTVATVMDGSDWRSSAREYDLVVPAAGNYTIDVMSAEGSRDDPKMMLMQDGREVGANDDGGDGNNARLAMPLAPGSYRVRVWNYTQTAGQQHQFTIAVTTAGAATPSATGGK